MLQNIPLRSIINRICQKRLVSMAMPGIILHMIQIHCDFIGFPKLIHLISVLLTQRAKTQLVIIHLN